MPMNNIIIDAVLNEGTGIWSFKQSFSIGFVFSEQQLPTRLAVEKVIVAILRFSRSPQVSMHHAVPCGC